MIFQCHIICIHPKEVLLQNMNDMLLHVIILSDNDQEESIRNCKITSYIMDSCLNFQTTDIFAI